MHEKVDHSMAEKGNQSMCAEAHRVFASRLHSLRRFQGNDCVRHAALPLSEHTGSEIAVGKLELGVRPDSAKIKLKWLECVRLLM